MTQICDLSALVYQIVNSGSKTRCPFKKYSFKNFFLKFQLNFNCKIEKNHFLAMYKMNCKYMRQEFLYISFKILKGHGHDIGQILFFFFFIINNALGIHF